MGLKNAGFVLKYASRDVKYHLTVDGRPACGARVDMDAYEPDAERWDDVPEADRCKRCAKSAPKTA